MNIIVKILKKTQKVMIFLEKEMLYLSIIKFLTQWEP